jgi:hypothetical protein
MRAAFSFSFVVLSRSSHATQQMVRLSGWQGTVQASSQEMLPSPSHSTVTASASSS